MVAGKGPFDSTRLRWGYEVWPIEHLEITEEAELHLFFVLICSHIVFWVDFDDWRTLFGWIMFYCWRWYQRHVAEQHGPWVVSGCFYWCVHRWRGHRLAWIEKEQNLVSGSVTACDLHQQRSVSRIVMLISSNPEILDFCLQNPLQVQQERASLCTSGPRCRHADHHCNRPWEVTMAFRVSGF